MVAGLEDVHRGQRITVLHIISGDAWAGAEAQFLNTIESLPHFPGFRFVCLLFNAGILKTKLDQLPLQTLLLDESSQSAFTMAFHLRRILRDLNPDIIHVHRIKEHAMTLLATTFNKSVPIVRTIHGITAPKTSGRLLTRAKSTIAVWFDSIVTRYFTSALVVVSKDLETIFRNKNIKTPIFQIYNTISSRTYGAPVERSSIRQRYGAQGRFWIATAARLIEVKNLPMLVKAGHYLLTCQLPVKISIFGDGPLRKELETLIASIGVQHGIQLHGFTPDMMPILKSIDAFVLCSDHEGVPIAVLEAMAAHTPVVCTRVGGMAEIIQDGVSGLLVPAGDNENLGRALEILYSDPMKRYAMAARAHTIVTTQFSPEHSAAQLRMIYTGLAQQTALEVSCKSESG